MFIRFALAEFLSVNELGIEDQRPDQLLDGLTLAVAADVGIRYRGVLARFFRWLFRLGQIEDPLLERKLRKNRQSLDEQRKRHSDPDRKRV